MASPPDQAIKFRTACRVCRDRKVKCDKVLPCRNCVQADIVCSFPPQVRTVRRPKREGSKLLSAGTDQSLLDRIHRLEDILKNHVPHLPENGVHHGPTASQIDALVGTPSSLGQMSPGVHQMRTAGGILTTSVEDASSEWSLESKAPTPPAAPETMDATDTGTVVGCETDTYWSKIENECAGLVFLKATPSSEPPARTESSHKQRTLSPGMAPAADLSGVNFPFPHPLDGMLPPLLPLAQRRICWAKYVENVDPLLKILHKPTVEGLITVRDVHYYRMHAATAALMQAVCLLAVISMPDRDVGENLACEKQPLMQLCASRVEQTLMAANFLDARDLTTMQALLLYLYYLKHKEDSRLYGLRGVTVFLAARLGLNRDRVPTGISRLEAELRRRLWWQLITLVDQPDDCAIDYAPPSVGADTRLPMNVNDVELAQSDNTSTYGTERRGFTELSFCLMQYEITRLFNRIRFECNHAEDMSRPRLDSAVERLNLSRLRMESRYFQEAVEPSPLAKFAADAVAMILAKRRVLMHISPDLSSDGVPLTQYDYDHLFLLSVHVLELSRSLQTAHTFEKWRWLSGTYFQWSVANFVVKDLAIRPASTATKRAWGVINGILDYWPESTRSSPKATALKELITYAALRRDELTICRLGMPMPMPMALPESRDGGPITHRSATAPEERLRDSLSWSAYRVRQGSSQMNIDDLFAAEANNMFGANFSSDFDFI